MVGIEKEVQIQMISPKYNVFVVKYLHVDHGR